jgi:hypothetical protein
VFPLGGFRCRIPELEAFHRELGIPIRRGRGRYETEQLYVRFCFPHTTAADAFRDRFGGKRLTYTPQKPGPRALKLKPKRIYAPRVVADHIMLQEDFERLHKFLLEMEDLSEVSDDIRELVEENGRSWCISYRRRWRSPVYLLPQCANKRRADNCSPNCR